MRKNWCVALLETHVSKSRCGAHSLC